jgi:hypothetical protein
MISGAHLIIADPYFLLMTGPLLTQAGRSVTLKKNNRTAMPNTLAATTRKPPRKFSIHEVIALN